MGWMIQHEVVSQLSITVLLFQHIPGFGRRWASYQFRSDAPEHTSAGFWEKLDARPRLTPPHQKLVAGHQQVRKQPLAQLALLLWSIIGWCRHLPGKVLPGRTRHSGNTGQGAGKREEGWSPPTLKARGQGYVCKVAHSCLWLWSVTLVGCTLGPSGEFSDSGLQAILPSTQGGNTNS